MKIISQRKYNTRLKAITRNTYFNWNRILKTY